MRPELIVIPPQRHSLECPCVQCVRFWEKLQSEKHLDTRDLDWLDKIAVACEEDRTPEREAILAARVNFGRRR